MKAGMFGRGDRILLWVASDGYVVNGQWKVTYYPETDEVSGEMGVRYQRICDAVPVYGPNGEDYNYVIDAHQGMVNRRKTAIPLETS